MLVSLAGALLVRFQPMIAPLVLAIILAYLLRPVVAGLVAKTWLGWRAAVVLIYLGSLVGLAVLFTAAGIAIVQQAQGLYHAVMQIISPDLPAQLRHLLSAPVQLGPWRGSTFPSRSSLARMEWISARSTGRRSTSNCSLACGRACSGLVRASGPWPPRRPRPWPGYSLS